MRFLRIMLIISVSFVLGIAFAVFSINFGLEHFAGGYLLNIFNKKVPELLNRKITAQSIGVSLLNGEVVLKGVKVESSLGGLERPALSIPVISLKISLSDLPKNKLIIEKVVLIQPTLNAGSNDLSKKDSMLSYISGLRGLGVGPKNLYIEKGSFVMHIDPKTALYVLTDFNMSIENLPIDAAVIGRQVRVKASAKIPSVKPGVLDLNLNFNSLAPKYNFAGEFKAIDIYIPYFSPFLKGNDEIILKNGTLEIRSNVNCAENWVTASNMITLNRLSMESTSKKIFGIPKDVATQFFEANNVAFDLPINGDIFNLKIDFKTASTQIMYKALQGRFKSESFTRRVAESFGERIGEKLQELFSKFL